MTEVSGERSMAHLRAEVLAEHRRIRDITQRIEDARELTELLRRLREFRSLLEPHFSSEEAPGELYDTIRTMAPRHLGRLEQLTNEHRMFLSDIDRLAGLARACLDGPVAEILAQARDLAWRLHQHEARENELLMDGAYTDLGQGD